MADMYMYTLIYMPFTHLTFANLLSLCSMDCVLLNIHGNLQRRNANQTRL